MLKVAKGNTENPIYKNHKDIWKKMDRFQSAKDVSDIPDDRKVLTYILNKFSNIKLMNYQTLTTYHLSQMTK